MSAPLAAYRLTGQLTVALPPAPKEIPANVPWQSLPTDTELSAVHA
jgi:hypothetical protein